jgi:COP9 signalosome complex subunit 3
MQSIIYILVPATCLVFLGSKRFARSLELLLQAMTAPAVVANAIVIAAYKKLVLVSLIHTGASWGCLSEI